MAQIFKWLSRLFGAMAVLAALAAALVWVLLGGSLPDYDRDFTVEGVEGPVTLLRDIHALPEVRTLASMPRPLGHSPPCFPARTARGSLYCRFF